MSASDYTYLRRMRHVQNMPCNQYANTVVSCVPSTNYNHSGHVNYNYTPPPPCPPPCPSPCSSSHQHHHQHEHQHSGCDHCAAPPTPPSCNHQPLPQHHHYHGFPSPVSQPTINTHVNASCSCSVPYYPQPQICHTQAMNQHMMCAPASHPQQCAPAGIPYGAGDVYSTTMNLYLITPTQCGTVNFIVDCGMSYAAGTKVSCESIDASGNSFEGTVYSYNSFSGEITIYDIKHINGTFNTPVRYSVMIRTAAKEFNLLRDRITALYKEVFNIDLTEPACGTGPVVDPGPGPGPGTGPTQAQATLVVNLFKYFFNQTISSDSDYALTETYLTAKLKHLYQYFFNVDITTNTTFNPNNNGVSLSTLNSKISQLYLYFFNNDLSSGSITIV